MDSYYHGTKEKTEFSQRSDVLKYTFNIQHQCSGASAVSVGERSETLERKRKMENIYQGPERKRSKDSFEELPSPNVFSPGQGQQVKDQAFSSSLQPSSWIWDAIWREVLRTWPWGGSENWQKAEEHAVHQHCKLTTLFVFSYFMLQISKWQDQLDRYILVL